MLVLMGEHTHGPIYFKHNAFSHPEPAHDLEVRQWNSFEHGMSLLESAVEMAQKPERLRIFQGREFGGYDGIDAHWGNTAGALEYVGEILGGRADPKHQELGGSS